MLVPTSPIIAATAMEDRKASGGASAAGGGGSWPPAIIAQATCSPSVLGCCRFWGSWRSRFSGTLLLFQLLPGCAFGGAPFSACAAGKLPLPLLKLLLLLLINGGWLLPVALRLVGDPVRGVTGESTGLYVGACGFGVGGGFFGVGGTVGGGFGVGGARARASGLDKGRQGRPSRMSSIVTLSMT